MAVMKYILLILSISASSYADPTACATSGISGRRAIPVKSSTTVLSAGIRDFSLDIPDGRIYACPLVNLKYLVGQEEISCDYDIPPAVYSNNPSTAIVVRQGSLLQAGTAYIVYYCDNTP